MRRLKLFLLLVVILLATFALTSYAETSTNTFDVNTTTDSVDAAPGNSICSDAGGNCSLRAAIMEANALSPANVTINVPAGTYNLTITYGAEEDASASNDLDITNSGSTMITGVGTGQDVIINAYTIGHRAFDLLSGAKLYLKNLTITNGNASGGFGGGIHVRSGATLDMDHVIITGNEADYGGGIYNAGTITGTLVAITSNTASGSNGYGGGIYLAGTTNNSVSLTRSLISDNSSFYGGGIYNGGNNSYDSPVGGTLNLENVTIGHNSAQWNGAGVYLYQGSRSYFVNCTIAYNANGDSSSGAGITGIGANSFDFLNTLIFQNTGYGGVNNCYQIYNGSSSINNWVGLNDAYFNKSVPYGHNMEDNPGPDNDQSKCFQNVVSNISLDTTLTTAAALAGVGTYKLQTGSAAIDAGDPANYAALDVFGTTRPQGSVPDIGAYEFADTNEPPGTPVLTSPASGSNVFGSSVRLYWQKSTDPESGNVTYRLQIAEDSGFTVNLRTFEVDGNGIILTGMMLPFLPLIGWGVRNRRKKILMLLVAAMLMATSLFVGCGSGGWGTAGTGDENSVSYEVIGLDSGKTYYWRVIAVDEQDKTSDPSEIRSFTTN